MVGGERDGAVRAQASVELEAELVGDERLGRDGLEVVDVRAGLAADDEQVAHALGGDERGAGALALDDGVGGDGGAVHDEVGGDAERVDALEDGARGVVGCRGALVELGRRRRATARSR